MSSDGQQGDVISEDDKFYTLPSGRLRKINRHGTDGSLGLAREVKLWPTPTGTERSGINPETGKGAGLSKTVKQWSTPATRDYKGAVVPETLEAKGRGVTNSLGDAINKGGQQGSLNPDWVEWLMGFDIGFSDIDCDEPEPHPGWDDDPAEIFPTVSSSRRGPHTHREIVGDRQVRAHKSGQTAGMTLETYIQHNPKPKEMWPTPNASVDLVDGRDLQNQIDTRQALNMPELVRVKSGHDHNIPRLTTHKENRVNRLKALGNAVVPQQAKLALELLIVE